jgi:hypothetical protein
LDRICRAGIPEAFSLLNELENTSVRAISVDRHSRPGHALVALGAVRVDERRRRL